MKQAKTMLQLYDQWLASDRGQACIHKARERYPEYNSGGVDTDKACDFICSAFKDKIDRDLDETEESELYENVFNGLT